MSQCTTGHEISSCTMLGCIRGQDRPTAFHHSQELLNRSVLIFWLVLDEKEGGGVQGTHFKVFDWGSSGSTAAVIAQISPLLLGSQVELEIRVKVNPVQFPSYRVVVAVPAAAHPPTLQLHDICLYPPLLLV